MLYGTRSRSAWMLVSDSSCLMMVRKGLEVAAFGRCGHGSVTNLMQQSPPSRTSTHTNPDKLCMCTSSPVFELRTQPPVTTIGLHPQLNLSNPVSKPAPGVEVHAGYQ